MKCEQMWKEKMDKECWMLFVEFVVVKVKDYFEFIDNIFDE